MSAVGGIATEVIELTGHAESDAAMLDEAAAAALTCASVARGRPLSPADGHLRIVHVVTGGERFEALALFSCLEGDTAPGCTNLRSKLRIRAAMLRQLESMPVRTARHVAFSGAREHLLIERYNVDHPSAENSYALPLMTAVADQPQPVTDAVEAMTLLSKTRHVNRDDLAAVRLLREINRLLGNSDEALMGLEVRMWADNQISLAPCAGLATEGIFSEQPADAPESARPSALAAKFVFELIHALPEHESYLVERVALRRPSSTH